MRRFTLMEACWCSAGDKLGGLTQVAPNPNNPNVTVADTCGGGA